MNRIAIIGQSHLKQSRLCVLFWRGPFCDITQIVCVGAMFKHGHDKQLNFGAFSFAFQGTCEIDQELCRLSHICAFWTCCAQPQQIPAGIVTNWFQPITLRIHWRTTCSFFIVPQNCASVVRVEPDSIIRMGIQMMFLFRQAQANLQKVDSVHCVSTLASLSISPRRTKAKQAEAQEAEHFSQRS